MGKKSLNKNSKYIKYKAYCLHIGFFIFFYNRGKAATYTKGFNEQCKSAWGPMGGYYYTKGIGRVSKTTKGIYSIFENDQRDNSNLRK